jgi:hypothetical protein
LWSLLEHQKCRFLAISFNLAKLHNTYGNQNLNYLSLNGQCGVWLMMVGSLHVYKGRDRQGAVQFIILTLRLIRIVMVSSQGRLETNIDPEWPDQVYGYSYCVQNCAYFGCFFYLLYLYKTLKRPNFGLDVTPQLPSIGS